MGKTSVVVLPLKVWREIEDYLEDLEMSQSRHLAARIKKARAQKKLYSAAEVKKLLAIWSMNLRFTKDAMKDLRGFEIAIRKRIIEKLDFYMAMDDPLKFAKALRDSKFGEYRFRVGEYRVIFDVRENDIIILAIGHRGEIYRWCKIKNRRLCGTAISGLDGGLRSWTRILRAELL